MLALADEKRYPRCPELTRRPSESRGITRVLPGKVDQLRSGTGSSSNSALVFMSAVTSTGTPNVI